MRDMMDEHHQALLLLGHPQGELELRKEISEYLYHARGVHCTPEQIVIGAGSEILLHQLILLFNQHTVYGVEDPGFHLIQRILKSYPNEVRPLKVDEEGVDIDSITSSNVQVAYVTPSRHFPSGTILSINRRSKLLKWASESAERYIIEDDYDSEFRYSGKSIPSLQSMDLGEKVIYLGSFSKSLIPSIRISFMVLPTPLLKKYQTELSFYHSTVSRVDQHILAAFMRNGDFERHLNRMRKIYRRKLEIVVDTLNPYSETIRIVGERSGLHIVLEVDLGLAEEVLVGRAKENNIKIYPISQYSLGNRSGDIPKIILGFAGIPEEELKQALDSLLNAWRL